MKAVRFNHATNPDRDVVAALSFDALVLASLGDEGKTLDAWCELVPIDAGVVTVLDDVCDPVAQRQGFDIEDHEIVTTDVTSTGHATMEGIADHSARAHP